MPHSLVKAVLLTQSSKPSQPNVGFILGPSLPLHPYNHFVRICGISLLSTSCTYNPSLSSSPAPIHSATIFTPAPTASSLAFPYFLWWMQVWSCYVPAHHNFQGQDKPTRPQPRAHFSGLTTACPFSCSSAAPRALDVLPNCSLWGPWVQSPHLHSPMFSSYNVFPFLVSLLPPPSSLSCLLPVHQNLIKVTLSGKHPCHPSPV